MSRLRIIVTGLITQHPLLGGITWHYLQYVVGLDALGHDVYYFEDSGEHPYNLDGGISGNDWLANDCSANVGYLAKIMARYGFQERWAYRCPLESRWYGLAARQRRAIVDSADLLINVSGSLEQPGHYRQIPHLLYIDTDPVVTQIKIATGGVDFAHRVAIHDSHFSFGESFSEAMPATDYDWRPTRQPIILNEWRTASPLRDVYTTVMNWTSYEPLLYAGQRYGQKDVEFRRFLELPALVAPIKLEVALSGTEHQEWQADDDLLPAAFDVRKDYSVGWTHKDLVKHAGWQVVDAVKVGGDLDSYRAYIENSKAEWSVAKNVYVLGQPGWFSERSACYLAAGRPVIVQDTGFGTILPTGEGILAFQTVQEAASAIRVVETHYARHARAAREIAEAYFDAGKVLSRLIDTAMSNRDPIVRTAL